MHTTLKKLDKLLAHPFIRSIKVYQLLLSPDQWLPSPWLKGRVCAHEPHCSKYGVECFRRYGFFRWLLYTTMRVSSCTPSNDVKYDPSHYRVVFLSSAPIGVPYLEALTQDEHYEVVGVVTTPDKPMGRGLTLTANPVKTAWEKLGLPVLTPTKINPDKSDEWRAFSEELKALNPDFLVVIAYGKILPQSILDIPALGPINVHGSLLPRWRGASPIQSVFLAGEKESGVTYMVMEAGLDTGPMLGIRPVDLPLSWTSRELIDRMKAPDQTKALCKILRLYGKGEVTPIRQDDALATHCTKIQKEDGLFSLDDTLEAVYRKYQAYILWPKIHFLHGETPVTVERIVVDETLRESQKGLPFAGNKAITALEVKPAGKKTMTRKDFENGHGKNKH